MKDSNFRRIVCIRKVFQMTAISVIFVLIISIVIVFTTGQEEEEVDCGPIQNLRITETEFHMRADWEPPLGTQCNTELFYVVYGINGINDSGFSEDNYIELDKASCTLYEFAVQSRSMNGAPLEWVNATKTSRIAGSGQIENLQITENRLTWNPPENSDPCNVKYIVYTDREGFDSTTEIVSLTENEIQLIPCGNHLISVTTTLPDLDDWMAEPVQLRHRGPTTKLPPNHYSTRPNLNGALVKWYEQPEDNLCDFEKIEFAYILTTLKETNNFNFQSFDKSEDSFYNLIDLEPNKDYLYKARWILTGTNGDDSEFINFETHNMDEPSIHPEVTSDGNGLRIQWDQSYPNSFVTDHIILVRDMGPVHFIPESCHQEPLFWMEQRKPHEDLVLIVHPIFPNHNYSIEVETFFGSLNVYTSSWEYYITDKREPGEITFYSDTLEYNNGESYLVNTNIFWKIPCDANGPLDDFLIRIEGKLENPNLSTTPSCNLIEFTERFDCENNEICSITIDKLIPFFKYTVFITTTSYESNSWYNEINWELSELPDAYTPP
ncbi:uncharacterized protein [Onthophagus taurus]|uniref:uncharacterized protein n=1 Tax=Onthophagus taurus TaxID=166361 RepID=UPI000C1FE89B|nr:uncharacterized protein LOC111426794 [Onthophagus taurus]